MRKYIIAAGLALLAMTPAAAQQTKLLTAEKHNEYGLVYTLPVTALDVEVTAVREVRTAGPYYQYAKKYIGTDDVVKDDYEAWTVKSVKVRPYGVPNTDSRYIMQLKAGSTTYIGVAEDNMLLSINAEPRPQQLPERQDATVLEGEKLGDKEYLQYVGEDFIASQSSAKQAQMLAESLMEIREAKIALTHGTADPMPTDGKQLELMLSSLAHQEKVLTAAFAGNITRETVTRNFTFIPGEGGRKVLFRLSDFAGFVEADDYSGDPFYINVEVTSQGELPTDAKGKKKEMPKDGVAYCVPGSANVTLSYKGKNLFKGEFDMAQYGVVFALDPKLFTDKKQPSYAIFDPATGALKEIATAIDTK